MSSVNARFFSPLPGGTFASPQAVADWIERNIPCVVGPWPSEWLVEVKAAARLNGLPDQVVEQAVLTLHSRGLRFESPPQAPPGYVQPPAMKPTAPGDKEKGAIAGARVLEEMYRKAERSDDIEGMETAARAFVELVGEEVETSGQPMPGRGAMEKDRNRRLELRETLLREAPGLARIARNLGTYELATMRQRIGQWARQQMLNRQARMHRRR